MYDWGNNCPWTAETGGDASQDNFTDGQQTVSSGMKGENDLEEPTNDGT